MDTIANAPLAQPDCMCGSPQILSPLPKAGNDTALWVTNSDVPAVLDRLVAALANHELSVANIDASVRRMARPRPSVAVMINSAKNLPSRRSQAWTGTDESPSEPGHGPEKGEELDDN